MKFLVLGKKENKKIIYCFFFSKTFRSWTVEQKFGLFSNSPRSPSPLSITHKPSSSPSSRETNNALPHHIWIHFLFRRFDVIRDSSKEQLNIMAKILQVALSTQMRFF